MTITTKIVLGTIALMLVVALVGYVALTEGLWPGRPGRMQKAAAAFKGRSIEEGALLYQNYCIGCHGLQGRGIPEVAPALNAADLFDGRRLKEIGYTGSVENYLKSVIAAGRPVKSNPGYPQPMPTWGQQYGGPLRTDQVNNLVAFIMNWQDEALAGVSAQPEPVIGVGTDLNVELPPGNAANGKQVFQAHACNACHALTPGQTTVGPNLAGIANTAATRKDGYDAIKYIRESIVLPKAFLVPGFTDVMPTTFGERLSAQDLADLIAFLLEQK